MNNEMQNRLDMCQELLIFAKAKGREMEPDEAEFYEAGYSAGIAAAERIEAARIAAAPPAHAQDWIGISGSVAWHLADRHADGWPEIGDMMEAWADARAGARVAELESTIAELQPRPALESETLLKAMNAISRQLFDEQAAVLDDDDGREFRAGKMAGIVRLKSELKKHIQLASTSPTTTERN